jgi:serine/threonine protein kinase
MFKINHGQEEISNNNKKRFAKVKSGTTSYEYIQDIGSGGFGSVYLVKKENTNEQ